MPKLEVSNRIYARPTIYDFGMTRFSEEMQDSGVLKSFLIRGENFSRVTGFYLSSDDVIDSSIMTWVDAFSSYKLHISSIYPPFSGFKLNSYEIINNETVIIDIQIPSEFNSASLVAINPAGYFSLPVFFSEPEFSEPELSGYLVSNSGISLVNGLYVYSRMYEGNPTYVYNDFELITDNTGRWLLMGFGQNLYLHPYETSADTPADEEWVLGFGLLPVPTVEAVYI